MWICTWYMILKSIHRKFSTNRVINVKNVFRKEKKPNLYEIPAMSYHRVYYIHINIKYYISFYVIFFCLLAIYFRMWICTWYMILKSIHRKFSTNRVINVKNVFRKEKKPNLYEIPAMSYHSVYYIHINIKYYISFYVIFFCLLASHILVI